MKEHSPTVSTLATPPEADVLKLPEPAPGDLLTAVLQKGARQLLADAVETEVAEWLAARVHLVDEHGHRQVVRNGHLPQREILTGIGKVPVQMPRIHDRRPAGQAEKFTSAILPPYLRKAKAIEELIPWLYLRGISTGDFGPALSALLGPNAKGLSANTITRLKSIWEDEQKAWSARSLAGKRFVYVWVDAIHFNIRLEEDRQCILVLMGATETGEKVLIAIADGYAESEQAWKAMLLDVKSRGLTEDPLVAIGDGALGFWKALPQVWPKTRTQRCWVHKAQNVMGKLPKRLQGQANDLLRQIWMAPTKVTANTAYDNFITTYESKYPGATDCLNKDRDALLVFYDFPAEHWIHLRTTNPIESVFSTVRLRTAKTKGMGTRVACLAMVFKLAEYASNSWRLLNGSALIQDVIAGVQFNDGIKTPSPSKVAA